MNASKKKPEKSRKTSTVRLKVRIDYINPEAKQVFVAGTFNDWHPAVTEMLSVGDGWWAKELALEPGEYEYRLVVDGVWTTDPRCTETTTNPFGDQNSILTVPKQAEN
jgi:1,4-alpha-glucan branching enzyme